MASHSRIKVELVMIHDSIWVGAHFQAIEFRCNCGCGENEIYQCVVHALD